MRTVQISEFSQIIIILIKNNQNDCVIKIFNEILNARENRIYGPSFLPKKEFITEIDDFVIVKVAASFISEYYTRTHTIPTFADIRSFRIYKQGWNCNSDNTKPMCVNDYTASYIKAFEDFQSPSNFTKQECLEYILYCLYHYVNLITHDIKTLRIK